MSEIDLMLLPATVAQDLRYGARMLMRNPGFTFVALVALAMGIGVNTAAFTIYKTMLGRTLDARDPGQMVNVAITRREGTDSVFSYSDYLAYRAHVHSLQGVIAQGHGADLLKLTGVGRDAEKKTSSTGSLLGDLGFFPSVVNAEFAGTAFVSENYFGVLGEAPLQGRTFDGMREEEITRHPVVMISENYWKSRLGSDPSIVGKSVQLNNVAVTILGVTPHNFAGTALAVPDFWMPLVLHSMVHPRDPKLQGVDTICCRIYGRLAQGASMGQAQEEMGALAEHLRMLHEPHSMQAKPGRMLLWPGSPFPRKLDGGLQFALLLVMVAVGMVLVIACANVASLQLARSAARQNELRMRMSLGASRPRLIRQLLTESALLGAVAGVLALVVTWGALEMVVSAAGRIIPPEYGTLVYRVAPDMQVFAYVFAISIFAGILFGLTPALESSRSALASSFKADTGSKRSRGMRNALITAQVAVSLVLMIAGSMLIRSALHAIHDEPGYETKQVVDIDFSFPESLKYDAAYKRVFLSELQTRVNAMPGVVATTIGRAPDEGGFRTAAVTTGGSKPGAQSAKAYVYFTYVQPNYFSTLDMKQIAGRGFAAQAGEPEASAIVSESAAKRLWPGQNPIGRTLRLADTDTISTARKPDATTVEVIGIMHDAVGMMIDGSDAEMVYLPMREDQTSGAPLVVHTRQDETSFNNAFRSAVVSLDPDVAYTSVTLDALLKQGPRFLISSLSALVACVIGAVGLLLALMGIYGTVRYIVVLRTREVGIRMALGAQKEQIVRLILRDSTRPILVGLIVGMVLSVGASYLLRGVLYGMHRVDGISFAGMSLLFFTVALIAAYVPSRKATRIDPMVALRYE